MKIRLLLALATVSVATTAFAAAAQPQAAATDAATYPLSHCIVSGDDLGSDAVTYVYKQPGKPDRVLKFCCKDCIKDFEKSPAKYLADFDAAIAKGQTAATKPAGHMGAACTMSADHKGMASTASGEHMGAGCAMSGECSQECHDMVSAYVSVSEALAADDLASAKHAAGTLEKQATAAKHDTVAEAAREIAAASDLSAARKAFKAASGEIAPMAQHAKGYVVMTCPMAKADWVQTDSNVRNPYFGKAMLTCGEPKGAAAAE